MSTKHTPGPWTLETVPTSCGVCHKVGPFPGKHEEDKPRHACLYSDYPALGSNPRDQELFANARLIASAPELLALLQEVFSIGDRLVDDVYGHEFVQNAKAAITKATGAAQ